MRSGAPVTHVGGPEVAGGPDRILTQLRAKPVDVLLLDAQVLRMAADVAEGVDPEVPVFVHGEDLVAGGVGTVVHACGGKQVGGSDYPVLSYIVLEITA